MSSSTDAALDELCDSYLALSTKSPSTDPTVDLEPADIERLNTLRDKYLALSGLTTKNDEYEVLLPYEKDISKFDQHKGRRPRALLYDLVSGPTPVNPFADPKHPVHGQALELDFLEQPQVILGGLRGRCIQDKLLLLEKHGIANTWYVDGSDPSILEVEPGHSLHAKSGLATPTYDAFDWSEDPRTVKIVGDYAVVKNDQKVLDSFVRALESKLALAPLPVHVFIIPSGGGKTTLARDAHVQGRAWMDEYIVVDVDDIYRTSDTLKKLNHTLSVEALMSNDWSRLTWFQSLAIASWVERQDKPVVILSHSTDHYAPSQSQIEAMSSCKRPLFTMVTKGGFKRTLKKHKRTVRTRNWKARVDLKHGLDMMLVNWNSSDVPVHSLEEGKALLLDFITSAAAKASPSPVWDADLQTDV
jgi:hypothetical protein